MPALDVVEETIPTVGRFKALLSQLLNEASVAKDTTTIEPALTANDFVNLSDRVLSTLSQPEGKQPKDGQDGSAAEAHKAVIETAARELFIKLIVRASLHQCIETS